MDGSNLGLDDGQAEEGDGPEAVKYLKQEHHYSCVCNIFIHLVEALFFL
jgi:hypothetical protein